MLLVYWVCVLLCDYCCYCLLGYWLEVKIINFINYCLVLNVIIVIGCLFFNIC